MGVGGAPLAIETADCALMDNDLCKIPRLLRISKRTRVKVIQNVTFSLVTKAVMIGLTFAGYVSLGIAIGVDVGAMLIVTLNGVSLLEAPNMAVRQSSARPMQAGGDFV
jgi:Cd2+/Zn2+-exporting ATPase